MYSESSRLSQAVTDFHTARRRASMQAMISRFTGRATDLLAFDEVRRKLSASEMAGRERREIPLDAVIGSVGRYADFNREFLPLRVADQDRWAGVKVASENFQGLPPILVYQIGEAYFVLDGNHRVSIARQDGATHIEAYVKTLHTRVPVEADITQEEIIILAEYADFLDQTDLDEMRPEVDLRVTTPGQYEFLLQQIELQRFVMGEPGGGEQPPYPAAVGQWYDEIYIPIVEMIRERNFLRDFPGRTEADLFVWALEHQAAISDELGWEVRTDAALQNLAQNFQAAPGRFPGRIRDLILEAVHLDRVGAGPLTGQWRQSHLESRRGRMFADIMVLINGSNTGQMALRAALDVAAQENARLKGLYFTNQTLDSKDIGELQHSFESQCQQAKVKGSLLLISEEPGETIIEHSRWVDLVILPLGTGLTPPFGTLDFRSLIQRCYTPLWIMPGTYRFPQRILLAFDGSKKGQEALFLAAYLARFWGLDLVVMTVLPPGDQHPAPEALSSAQEYLDAYQIQARFDHAHERVADGILKGAQEYDCGLILAGGYGREPFFGGLKKHTVDQLIDRGQIPLLICR